MRPKVTALVLLMAAVATGLILFTSNHKNATPNPPPPQTVADQNAGSPSDKPAPIPLTVPRPALPSQETTAAPAATNTNTATSARDRVAELMALARNNDQASLNTICSELANPDKEIRAGALAAVVQFGDPAVAPSLRALAAQTEDPDEKKAILAAADQLELPPLNSLKRPASTNSPP